MTGAQSTSTSHTDSLSALQHAYVLDHSAVGFAYEHHRNLKAAEKARRKAQAQSTDMTATGAAYQHAYVLDNTAFAFVDQQRQEAKAAQKKALKQKRREAEKLGEDDGASVRSFASSTRDLLREKLWRREKRAEESQKVMAAQVKMV